MRAECSLLEFMRQMWPVLEPGREMREGWALAAMAAHLEAVADGTIQNLLINVPPGFSKSLLTGVFLPAWLWGPRNRPQARFCSWSYAEQLTVRDNRKCRLLVESDSYRARWGARFHLAGDQSEKKFFENNRTGYKFAAGIHGGSTGHRGDFKVIDDPHKVGEAESDVKREDALQFLTEVYPSRDTDEDTSSIVIMQRVHELDVSGHIIANAADMGYDHLCLPMRYEADHPTPSRTALGFVDPRTEDGELLFPELFPEARVARMEAELRSWGGDYAVAGQLQQRPFSRGGGLFNKDNFVVVDQAPDDIIRTVRGWDLAGTKQKTSAYSVGVLLGICRSGQLVILDVERLRGGPLEVERRMKACAERDGHRVAISIPQDPGQAGLSQKAHLAQLLHGFVVHFSPETGDKVHRARPVAAQVEAGNVLVVRAPWLQAFLAEAESFGPGSGFKDHVDALSRAYQWILRNQGKRVALVPGKAVVL
jgi:predicted phage terminase large subunit-like protein